MNVYYKWQTIFFCDVGVFEGQIPWHSAGDLKQFREDSVDLGLAHLRLHWGLLLWSHFCIQHMYLFACEC